MNRDNINNNGVWFYDDAERDADDKRTWDIVLHKYRNNTKTKEIWDIMHKYHKVLMNDAASERCKKFYENQNEKEKDNE